LSILLRLSSSVSSATALSSDFDDILNSSIRGKLEWTEIKK
jgi:hypothetical protein